MEILITIIVLIILLLLSAFFSSSETSITGVSEGRMLTLAKSGDKAAKRVLNLISKKEQIISSLLTGNNLVNVTASALATALSITWFGEVGVLYATIVMTFALLIFAEILPKSYALLNPDKIALKASPLLSIITVILSPITWLTQFAVKTIAALFRLKLEENTDHNEREEQLRGFIDLHDGEDPDLKHERKMMHSILDLDDIQIENIMTHRKNVTTINLDDNPKKNMKRILESPYTRIPLYQGADDDIKGILHVKALLRAMNKSPQAPLDLLKLAAKPWFVPETATLLDQLQAFRSRREHFAIVVDEYGSLMGVVTLEDILEQIVGKIEDEHDTLNRGFEKNGNGYIMEGTLTLREINRELDWQLPDDEASTLAGLILHEARLIPQAGQEFEFYGFRFKILARHRQQITKIKVTPPHTILE